MLKMVIEDSPTIFRDRLGLSPGRCIPQYARDNGADDISNTVVSTCTTDLTSWVKERAGCFSCRHLQMCGTRFSQDQAVLANRGLWD